MRESRPTRRAVDCYWCRGTYIYAKGTPQGLESFRGARDKGADQAQVECGFAGALHISGAPFGDCIGAYRVAIALNPQMACLRLNLAQLLFLKSDDLEAKRQLPGSDEDGPGRI